MEYAIFFDNGAWLVMRRMGDSSSVLTACPTLEIAVMELSLITGAPVGLKLITKE